MNTKIKERPIILNAQEVNAVLARDKTQHRVPVLTSKQVAAGFKWGYGIARTEAIFCKYEDVDFTKDNSVVVKCPLGAIGDRLWVRETHHVPDFLEDYEQDELKRGLITRDDLGMSYKADAPHMTPADGGWTSPVGMPRWASRLFLEITDIRIERVQDISEAEIKSQFIKTGIIRSKIAIDGTKVYNTASYATFEEWSESAIDAFQSYWNSIYGEGAWYRNDWVWVVEFKVVEGGDNAN